jgi:hypothetical protein
MTENVNLSSMSSPIWIYIRRKQIVFVYPGLINRTGSGILMILLGGSKEWWNAEPELYYKI